MAGDSKKKISIIAGSVVLVAAVVACVVVLVVNNNKSVDGDNGMSNSGGVSNSVKSIKSICQPTSYRKTCEEELTKAAGNSTDKKALVRAALQVPVDRLKEAYSHSKVLAEAAKDPANAEALKQCQTFFDSSIYDLEKALDKISGYSYSQMYKVVYDVQTWLSGANTFQGDCLEGFDNDAKSDAAVGMKKALNVSMEMTSNGLSIAAHLSKMIEEFNIPALLGGGSKRRLLHLHNMDAEGYPSWLSQGRRRLLQQSPWEITPTVIVAKDGSGHFKTIQEGIDAMPRNNTEFVVMLVKAGVYEEKVNVDRQLNKLVLIGEGPTKTRITGSLNVALMGISHNMTTFKSATFGVVAEEFMAKDIGFENTAGPDGHQAVAFRSQSDKSVLYNCHFDGYQDTLYTHAERQYYRDCLISGTVDFIFGNAAAMFQNCQIVIRKPSSNQQNIVTAHGSKNENEVTAYVLHNCTITGEPGLVPEDNPSYLGRPWKEFARTIYLQSQIESVIHPDGWMAWQGAPENSDNCFYLEVDNRGPGADKAKRVVWKGIKPQMTLEDAEQKYSVENFFHSRQKAADEGMWPQSIAVPISGILPNATQDA